MGPEGKKKRKEGPSKQRPAEGNHPNRNPDHAKNPSQIEKVCHLRKQNLLNRSPKKVGGAAPI